MATLTGSDGNDTFAETGNSDTIYANGGDDTVTVTTGVDTVHGGNDTDTLVVNYSVSPDNYITMARPLVGGVSGYEGQISMTGSRNVTFYGIEHFHITGGAYADSIKTGNGNDVVSLLGGADFVDVGAGFDTADGGSGTDGFSADFSADSQGVSIDLRNTVNAGAFGSFSDFEYFGTIIGSAFDDNFVSTGAGANETFHLGDGNDSATVLTGVDTVHGGSGTDTLVVDYSLSSDNYITMGSPLVGGASGYEGQISMTGSRNVTFYGIEHFHITGGAYADSIKTGNGNDVVSLLGGADFVDVGAGFDTADGGSGTDGFSADFSADSQGVSIDLRNTVNAGAFGSFSNFEYFGTITGTAFDDNFVSTGAGANETFHLGAGNDSATVLTGIDVVHGGNGIDTLVVDYSSASDNYISTSPLAAGVSGYEGQISMSGSRNVTFYGIEHFHITGGAYADTLRAGNGNDYIDGRGGADSMTGGAGDDVYVVDTPSDAVIENANEGTDEIRTALSSYSIAALANVENLTGTGAVNQTLTGNGGNNLIDGGVGADSMIGGAGDDIYVVDNAGDAITENVGQGTDEVRTSLASYSLGAVQELENLTGTSAAGQTLVGNTLVNVITGNAGNDFLNGAGGADRLVGGMGNDTYNVDQAGDVVVELEGEGEDIIYTSMLTYTLAALPNVENLYADSSTSGYHLTGNDGHNKMAGSAGNDALYGGAGNDLLQGHDGNDLLDGGSGADVLRGGAGDDKYVINFGDGALVQEFTAGAAGGTDTIETNLASFTLAGIANVENLTGTAATGQALTGNAGDNRITGGSGNDTLDGNGGTDTLVGGDGNDIYIVDSNDDVVTETDTGGTADEIRTAVSNYRLAENVEILTYTGSGGTALRGNTGNNLIKGGTGVDVVDLRDGGEDRGEGGAGNDGFYMAGALSSGDYIDGGAGTNDQLILQGNYSGLTTLGADALRNVEVLSLLSGAETMFGDTAGNLYDYNLKTVDENVAAGQRLVVDFTNLALGEDVTFDGSAETDGAFTFGGGLGVDTLTGGAGADLFLFRDGGRYGAGDTVNGGGGSDELALRGNYTGATAIVFQANTMTNIEALSILSGHNTWWGPVVGDFNYDLTMHDNNVAAGQRLVVDAGQLKAGEALKFDGSAETDGYFLIAGGAAADTLTGGAGNDTLVGGLGADDLTGGGGADSFRYRTTEESNGAAIDHVLDFTAGTDKIDLSRIDADTITAGDQAFHWIGSNAFSGAGAASAGQLRAYQDNGTWFAEGDTNGDGVADLVIQLTLQGPTPLGQGDFLL